jgi:Arc/MetJ-type ribon-helix-helix transcriptional regulator
MYRCDPGSASSCIRTYLTEIEEKTGDNESKKERMDRGAKKEGKRINEDRKQGKDIRACMHAHTHVRTYVRTHIYTRKYIHIYTHK